MTRQTTSRHDSSRSGESCRADEPRLPTLAQPTQTHIATGKKYSCNRYTHYPILLFAEAYLYVIIVKNILGVKAARGG